MLGACPVASDQPAQVAVEAQPLALGRRLEHAAPLAPRLDGLLARQHRLARDGRARRPPGGRGAKLGQLAVALGFQRVVGLALLDDALLVLRQLVGGQVALLGGGAGQDGVAGLAGGCPAAAQVVEQSHAVSLPTGTGVCEMVLPAAMQRKPS